MQYKIIVDKQSRTNPSSDKREYVIDIEELRYQGDVYDSLIITKEEDYVIRRLSLSEYGVLSVLNKEVKEPINDINIELFEGDNYIYLADMTGNYIYAEYLLKNEFTDMYITDAELNTAIKQTEKTIELSVNQKLIGYSTKQETKSAIELATESINLGVNKKLEDYSTKEEMNSAINIKADSITSSVSKTYATKDEVYSSVGTVNLVNNSDFSHQDESGNYDLKNWSMETASDTPNIVEKKEKSWLRLLEIHATTHPFNSVGIIQNIKPMQRNETYTLSLLYQNIEGQNGIRSKRLSASINYYSADGTYQHNNYKLFTPEDNLNEQKLEFTFTVADKPDIAYGILTLKGYTLNDDEYFYADVTNIQLEKGNVATEWRPSQTDFYYQVEQYSKVTQTVEELQFEVGKKVGEDEIISKINQSAEQVAIDANKISLKR